MNAVTHSSFQVESNTPETAYPTLTVIIPVRVTEARLDILDRLDYYLNDPHLPECIDFLVVDDGSRDEYFLKLLEKATPRRKVIRTGSQHYEDFNLARARNFAAQRATGQFIMFMDVDLAPYPGFFTSLLREIVLTGMTQHVHKFLMCPVIYLTEAGHEKFLCLPPEYRQQYFINAVLASDSENIEKFSSGTSVIALDRLYYLARGGQDEGFKGWGFEDYEFTTRLIRRTRQFPLPENWLSMAGNFMTISKYEGWKATYRLYGDWLACKGMYLFHIPHPIEEKYHSRKDINLKYLQARMLEEQDGLGEPAALPDLKAGTSLLFRSNPFCYDREFAPALGQIIWSHEDDFRDTNHFAEFLKENGISRVIFPNPYSNNRLLTLYRWCRANNIELRVCERGALPDAVYHDCSGFLNDSASYRPERWDRTLTRQELSNVQEYIQTLRGGSHMLEAQAQREDFTVLRKRLNIGRQQKVLLVPFQQPNDTVIRHFAGPVQTFQGFRSKIAALVKELGPEWKVIYKKHPAEDDLLPIEGAESANDSNIYDLLELCDAVAVINSGVGIYAMMFGKPLYVLGDAWYAHDGLCVSVGADDNLAQLIRAGFVLDYDRVLRFIHYLRFEFYSFGRMSQRRVRYEDGSPITATTAIDYYELRGWQAGCRSRPSKWSPIPNTSPLFDRYRHASNGQPKEHAQTRTDAARPSMAASKQRLLVSTNERIQKLKRFKIYSSVYGVFLSPEQKKRLKTNPADFFSHAKKPASKFGRMLVKRHLTSNGSPLKP